VSEIILAIDTSTDLAGVALFDGGVRAELSWRAGRKHSVQLLPQIEALLELVGVEREGLSALVVARGPGSFTGVRVGLAVAQGLSLALTIPAYGICSLDVLAAGQEGAERPIRCLLDAGRGRFATALYQWRDQAVERVDEIRGVGMDELVGLLEPSTVLCGDLSAVDRERLQQLLGRHVKVASPAMSLRRPAVLAQLGWYLLQSSAPSDLATLEPLYLSR
jgi:tRNA threonylcarbamoyladenosine biosynthesis protein TsaB